MSKESASKMESASDLAFTRSLLALSAVCPPNPYGALASGATMHQAATFLEPETFTFRLPDTGENE